MPATRGPYSGLRWRAAGPGYSVLTFSIEPVMDMAFRLPPLSSLRVFEAAARHNSFRKAADELNLTASAVSHGVQTLESWLGVELFHREARGLRLTSAGESYAPFVNEALSIIANATEQVPGRQATGTLSVSSASTFANRILIPRLEKFALQYPDFRVTIDTSQRVVDLTLDGFDVAIRYTSTKKQAAHWTLLGLETLLPVCSPALKRHFTGSSATKLLSQAPLIHTTCVSDDWIYWFRANGMEVPSSIEDGLRVDTIQMAIDAAIHGLGVVLGRGPFVDDEIESGRLVPVAGQAVPSGSGYWLVAAQTDFQKPEVKLFRNWLLSELGIADEHRKCSGPGTRTGSVNGRPVPS
jgi:LysR family transcriptional regulator, glycine cleavage system transcriptional activator